MTENPYDSPNTKSSPAKTRATRWLNWSGIALLSVAATCIAVMVVGMVLAFNTVATSTTTPSPSDVAQGISVASLPAMAAVPLAISGVVLIVAGVVIRQPVDRE